MEKNKSGSMSDPSKPDAKKKENEVWEDGNEMFLTGKNPFFDVVLTKSNLKPTYIMYLPVSISSVLPLATVPVVLSYGGKNWDLFYMGTGRPKFYSGWKEFAIENHLKVGDACIFELMENTTTKLKFKVIILKNEEMPPELQAGTSSKSAEEAIEID